MKIKKNHEEIMKIMKNHENHENHEKIENFRKIFEKIETVKRKSIYFHPKQLPRGPPPLQSENPDTSNFSEPAYAPPMDF